MYILEKYMNSITFKMRSVSVDAHKHSLFENLFVSSAYRKLSKPRMATETLHVI